jgi:hypothetical protein
MTKDEIKLVTFILLALVVGAAVQHFRTRPPSAGVPAPVPTPVPHGWAKPPYVLKKNR